MESGAALARWASLKDCAAMAESTPEPVEGTASAPTFLPDLVAELFDWLVSDLRYEVGPGHSGPRGSHTTRMYRSPKTMIEVYVTLWHGCSANLSLAPPGYPKTNFDPLQRRLEMHGLPPLPTVAEFRRRVQRHDVGPGDYEQVVRGALQPYADALRSLSRYELAGDWGL